MRSALADTLLQNSIPPGLNRLEQDIYSGSFYLLFFDGGSRGNPGPGNSGSVIVKMHPRSHAACAIWIASMAYGRASTTNNYAEYQGLLHGLRQAKATNYTPYMSLKIAPSYFPNSDPITRHEKLTWLCSSGRHEI